MLLWVEGDKSIIRASMDGFPATRAIILKIDPYPDNLDLILTLSVDTDKLYWTIFNRGGIERCNFDGTEKELLPIETAAFPQLVGVIGGWIHWSENIEDKKIIIRRTNYGQTNSTTEIYATESLLHRVIIVPELPRLLKDLRDPCEQSNCSDFCVQSSDRPEGFTCLCDRGSRVRGNICLGLSS